MHKHILTIVSPMSGKHEVEMWGSYGIVCPSLWTTNGSISYISKRIIESITRDDFRYTIEDSMIPLDSFESETKLFEALKDFYTKNL